MSSVVRLHLKKLILWAAPIAALACGGDGGTDVVLPSLTITTVTSGANSDSDGYMVSVDGQEGEPIGANATLTVERLPSGQHTVELSGIDGNCAVGENPRSVNVVSGATASVAFAITCSAEVGTVQVVTTTTGSGTDPDGYSLLLDGAEQGAIGVSATRNLTGLTLGSHDLGLAGVAANCQVSGENPRAVSVSAGATVEATFAVTCTAPGPTAGTIEVVTTTNGSGTDPDGYSLQLDGGQQGPIGLSATRNFVGLTPGSHTIGLTGVAPNCQVSGENPRTLTLSAGGTAQVAFAVTCTTPGPTTATLQVVTTTTGSDTDPDGYALLLDGAEQGAIGVSATRSLAGLAPGPRAVGLSGLAANCEVSGANPRDVTLTAGATVQVSFAVTCTAVGPATGTLVIAAVTTGASQDADGYLFSVDGGTSRPIGANATVRLANISAAQHTVELQGLAANCRVTGDNPVAVAVGAGETARVSFAVSCAATVGALAVTISGLPAGAAAAVTVRGPNDFSQRVTESRTLRELVPGDYLVGAENVATGGTTYTPAVARPSVRVAAGATEAVTVSYTAVVTAPTLNLRIDGLYLTQSTQTYTSAVPLVANRSGYLRVFVVANESNTARPIVRVRLSRPGGAEHILTIPAPEAQTPVRVREGTLGSSWNIQVDASHIQPGLSIDAEVDFDDAVRESNEADNRFPASGSKALSVQPVPTARIRFVSVQQGSSDPGNVSGANQLLQLTRRMHPLELVESDVRPGVFTASEPLSSDGSGWNQVLGDLDALRLTDPDGENRIYFGLAKLNYGRNQGLVGLAFTGQPTATTALGWDDPADANRVVAHELGHIWGRSHAPCGSPPSGTVDGNYRYPGGQIGVYGMDVPATALKATTSPDIMGYCFDGPWTSDYTYQGIMNFRQNNVSLTAAASAAPQRALLVWGRIVNGRPVLEPAFEVVTRPSLPKRPGPYSVSASSEDGSQLFSLSFDVAAVEDNHSGNGHFAFAVPLDQSASRLASLKLQGPTGGVNSSPSGARVAAPSAESIVARREGENVSLRWNAAEHPMIMVRDPDTGEVLSFARGGSALVRTTKGELDLDVSDGVKSQRLRLAIRRS